MTTENKQVCRSLAAMSVVPSWTAWLAEGLTEAEAKAKHHQLSNLLKTQRKRRRR